MRWYKANFGHIAIIRDSVCHLLYQIFPEEPRIEDIFIEREYSSINETIVTCTHRLSAYLDRIQKSLPMNEAAITKTLTNTSYITLPKITSRSQTQNTKDQPRPRRYKEKEFKLPPINEAPICHYNRFEYLRIIKLLLIGTSICPKVKREVNIQTATRSDYRIEEMSSSTIFTSNMNSKLEISVPSPKAAEVFMNTEESSVSILQSKHTTFHDINLSRYAEDCKEISRPFTSPTKGNKRLVYFRSKSVIFDPELGRIRPKYKRRNQTTSSHIEESPFVPRFTQTDEGDRASTAKRADTQTKGEIKESEFSECEDSITYQDNTTISGKKGLSSDSERQFRILRGENVKTVEDMYKVNIERAKFNKKYQSEFLKSHINNQVVYESRRDEMGFAIPADEWKLFMYKLRKTINAVKTRRRLRKRRKEKRRKRLPRVPGPNILWRKVFIQTQEKKHEAEVQRRYYSEINPDSFDTKLPDSIAAVINSSTKETTRRLVPSPSPPPIPTIKTFRKNPARFK